MRAASPRRQRGISGGLVLLALVLIGVAVLLARGLSHTDVAAKGEAGTRANLARIADALTGFAAANGRLPCPALGTDDAGDAVPAAAAANCTHASGVVPWRTLALRREDSLDGWGRKVSYRVFDGNTGLTQAGGMSATDCNADAVTNLGAPVNGRCDAAAPHANTYADFLQGKGLSVTDQGINKAGLAFVLISHGETGYGAFAAEGAGRGVLPTAGGSELTNTGATPPYIASTKSAAGVSPADVTHFDDVIAYRTIDEMVMSARLGPRRWGAPPTGASETFTRATVSAAVGAPVGNNTGVNIVTFGTGPGQFAVQAFGNTARNVSTGDVSGGQSEGIGAIGAGSSVTANTTVNSATNEFLRFTFVTLSRSLGITVVDFSSSGGQPERVRFTFYLAGTQVGSPLIKPACNVAVVQANYSVSPGVDFDSADVEPINTASGGFDTTLLVGSLRSCDSTVATSACIAPTAIPANNCP